VTIDLSRMKSVEGRRPRPVGMAMHPALFEKLVAQLLESDLGWAWDLRTIHGVPVITLEAMMESEIKVAMTPMAWMLMLVEKWREELRKGGEGIQ